MSGVHSGLTSSIPGGDEAGGASKRFTLVFEGDIRAVKGPIFRTVESFGKVVGAQSSDAFEHATELEETRDTLADALRGLLSCFPAAGRTREQMDAFMQAQKALALTYDERGA